MNPTMIDPELNQVLRINAEPYVFFDDARVHSALTDSPQGYLDHLLEALKAIAHGRADLELPPKAVFADPGERSDFRVMPCVVRFPDRVRKTVKIVGTNWPRRIVAGEISVGKAFALHSGENFIEAGFAACILSSARTGACAVTGLRLLMPDCRTLAIIGAGRVGYYTALYAATLPSIRRIEFADIDSRRAELAAEQIARQRPDLVTGCFDADDLSSAPDALVLATDSEQPLFDAAGHRPQVVISVGADTDWQRELGAAVLDHYAIFLDTPDSCHWGDLKRFEDEGRLRWRPMRDLQDLLREGKADRGPALFVSTGSALFDNLTIDYLLTGPWADRIDHGTIERSSRPAPPVSPDS
jgi:ornithine cyclodeaminase/alanine dehydrogenase-like protein (mu-crystallin family)